MNSFFKFILFNYFLCGSTSRSDTLCVNRALTGCTWSNIVTQKEKEGGATESPLRK